MNKKHIRTVIITALVLLTAIAAIVNIDIEPANRTSQSSAVLSSAEATQSPKPQADAVKNVQPVKELSSQEQSTQEQLTQEQPEKEHSEQQPEQKQLQKTEAELPKAEAQSEETTAPMSTGKADEHSIHADAAPPEPTPSNHNEHFCTIEIRCDTVTDTSKLENQAVAPFVPENGVILETTEIEFEPGESVFDILLRATKEKNIHMEFRSENAYVGGKYIEGINYLYEMDGGPLSGWMYKVNGRFPNYGCAGYGVGDGDVIVWLYSCNLGADVGDNSTW